MKAIPLENSSSLHETSLTEEMGWNLSMGEFCMQFSLNLHTPLKIHPQAYVTLDTQDANAPHSLPESCFSITDLTRWRLDISSYQTFDDYLASLARWHRCNYAKSKKIFHQYGCKITFIEGDWSDYAEEAYRLYTLVAERYSHGLYDLTFFQEIAKRPDYKLLCAWYENKMIAAFVVQDELPTLHGICGGLDYNHSTKSYAYSWLHYALFERAITAKKYQNIDVGFNSDEAKKAIGLKPIPSRIDFYTKGKVTERILKTLSHFVSASITPDSELKIKRKN